MMRIVLATVWCILGSSGKIFKLEFGHYFASDILQRLRSWILIEMLKLGSVNILNFKFSRDGDVWLRFWSKCLVEILKMKFDQDLCLNLWYDPIGYFGKMNSTLGSVVPLAMFKHEFSPNHGLNFSPIFSPHSRTLKYKFKTFLNIAICVIVCSILCFIFSVLRLYQLFLLLSREKKFHQITSLSDSFLSKYFPVWFNFGHF